MKPDLSIVCVLCDLTFVDPDKAVDHLRTHETTIDDWAIQVDCWTEYAA